MGRNTFESNGVYGCKDPAEGHKTLACLALLGEHHKGEKDDQHFAP